MRSRCATDASIRKRVELDLLKLEKPQSTQPRQTRLFIHMKAFKPPGGDLTVWSILWMLLGVSAVALPFEYGQRDGAMDFLFGAIIVVPSAMLWFGSYRAANCLILIMFGWMAMVLSDLIYVDSDWEQRLPSIFKLLLICYLVVRLWKWSDAHHPDMQKGSSAAA